jgi:hypothetical protein
MTVSPGALAKASEYNSVATLVNKVFGDNYSSAAPSDLNKTNHKFGWGAENIDDAVIESTLITAERLQFTVDRTNVMTDHCNINSTILMFSAPENAGRTSVDMNTPIRAEDLNIVENKINNSILSNNTHLTVDPYNASSLIATPVNGGPYTRLIPWTNQLIAEHKWTFDSYNHARYFFNSGGQLRLVMEMMGGSTAGYYNWSDVINEIGVLSFTWNNLMQSNNNYTAGTSEGKGFYDLTQYYGDGSDDGTDDEGLLFTSSGVTVSGYGYGAYYTPTSYYGFVSNYMAGYTSAYAYSSYSAYSAYSGSVYASSYGSYSAYANLRFKLYGKWANNGRDVVFKLVLDDNTYVEVIDGKIETTCTYLMPDVIERNSATFDVNPDPILSIINNFNSADDS